MMFNSIRWRVQAWHGLILVAVLSGFGVTAYKVAEDNQTRAIDQDLDRQLEGLLRPRPEDGPPEDPFRAGPGAFRERARRLIEKGAGTGRTYFVMWDEDGKMVARSPGSPEEAPPPKEGRSRGEGGPREDVETRTRGNAREVIRRMPFGDSAMAGRPIEEDQAAMRRLALWFVAAGAGILLLGLAGGGWLATRAIRPIEEISATAQRIAAGDLSQRIDVADTESELGRLAGVLNSTFARLESVFEQQAQFTADASHELRTPVTVVLMETQRALARERTAEDYREALEACQRAAQRMRKLTESLLELARLDAGVEPMKREETDLGRIAAECVELVRPLAEEYGVKVHNYPAAACCLGDAEKVTQLVTNLLTNAIHHSRPGGEVRVATNTDGTGAVLTVSDAGEGIPPEDLAHIFERFYRADKARSRGEGRNGLGLAICKAIVEAHRGTIEASSERGAGSTFTVRLPRCLTH
jgi:heavy metal sensor kinase